MKSDFDRWFTSYIEQDEECDSTLNTRASDAQLSGRVPAAKTLPLTILTRSTTNSLSAWVDQSFCLDYRYNENTKKTR